MNDNVDSPKQSTEARVLIMRLGSRDRQKRVAAEHRLQMMGTGGVDLLLAFLKNEKPRTAIRRSILTFLFIFVTGLCVSSWTNHEHGLIELLRVGCTGAFAGGFAYYFSVTRAQKRATIALAATDDVRAVGALIDALLYPGKETKRAATVALTRLLPRLQRSDAALITETQCKQLNKTLSTVGYAHGYAGTDADFVIALLQALEQIGDSDALPGVKKLAAGGGIARKNPRVREAANHCLPFLVEQTSQRNSQTLLRPSASKTAAPDVLLRPATHSCSEPQQLLRASSEQPE